MRKVRVLIQVGSNKDYNTKQFIERDVSIEVRDEEDMTKQLQFLMSDEFRAASARLVQFPEARPLIDAPPTIEQPLIG